MHASSAGAVLEDDAIRTSSDIYSKSRRRSKGFLILFVKLLIFLIFAVYGIWEDLGAWKRLLRGVPMICLQFWEFSKMP